MLKEKLTDLQRNITDNGNFADRIIEESFNIVKNAQKTRENATELQKQYDAAKTTLDQKLNNVKSTKERAKEVLNNAVNLATRVSKTQDDVFRLQDNDQGVALEGLERQLQMLIKKMNDYTMKLEAKAQDYKTCN